jgi:hypothetical protein
MAWIGEQDLGTKAVSAATSATVTLRIDGQDVAVPEGTSIMRAAALVGTDIPKLCATDTLEAFGSCRLCLVEIDGRNGYPASCTTPVADGMVVRTQTDRLAKLRRGVMELYISDHPLDCLTCSANGDCELQDQAGAVGLRDVVRSDQMHRLFALRARLRRDPGDVRADDRGQRLRLQGRGKPERQLSGIGLRVVWRLRPGLPDLRADREIGDRQGNARQSGHHNLRLLRGRLHLPGGNARRAARPYGAVEGRQGQSRA